MDDLGPELKRCPFCGSIAVLDEVRTVGWHHGQSRRITKYVAQCIIPKCLGHHNRSYIEIQTAVDKWNLRDGRLTEARNEPDMEKALEILREIRDRLE